MITFKSTSDLSKLSPDDPAFPTVEELIDQLITTYSPPGRLYDAIYLANNEYGLTFVIPDGACAAHSWDRKRRSKCSAHANTGSLNKQNLIYCRCVFFAHSGSSS